MKSIEPIPETMRAVMLYAYDGAPESLRVEARAVPRPERGQVLVKMSASPINPSDLMFLKGFYGVRKPLPVVPGWEGCGRVVASGDDWMSRWLLGKRVACASPNRTDGTWAQYMLTSANRCLPLSDTIDDEQGAMLIVNPLTAWALVDIARKRGLRAIIQTAAASALGKMVVRLCQHFKLEAIHIVRREEQAETLRQMGAVHVLNSQSDDFDKSLRKLAHELDARLAFEAVSGTLSAQVLRAMPAGSTLILYGALSESACMADPRDLIFERKRIEGFWLADWLGGRSVLQQVRLGRQIQPLVPTLLRSEVHAKVSLDRIHEALQAYAQSMSAGKWLITPNAEI